MRRALALVPHTPPAVRHASALLVEKGQRDEAIRLLEAALDHAFVPALGVQLALFLRGGDEEEVARAIAVLVEAGERRLEDGTPASDILELLVTTHLRMGDAAAAMDVLDLEWAAEAPTPLVRALRARQLLARGEQDEAVAEALGAYEGRNELSLTQDLRCLAQTLGLVRRYSEAISVFESFAKFTAYSFDVRSTINVALHAEDDATVLRVCSALRENGVFEADAVDVETGLLLKYQAHDEAIQIVGDYLARVPEDKLMRAKQSYAAALAGRSDLIESDPARLPGPEDVAPRNAQMILEVLRHGGNSEAAVEFAYAQVHLHFDDPIAHKNLILTAGPVGRAGAVASPEAVTERCAVEVLFERSGEARWYSIEGSLPKVADAELDPSHPYAQVLLGSRVGDSITFDEERLQPKEARVEKIVPRAIWLAHECMDSWELRFPNEHFVSKINVAPPKPEDELDEERPGVEPALLRAVDMRHQSLSDIESIYQQHPVPLHVFADAAGCSTLEALSRVTRRQELPIRCCNGTGPEFESALIALGDCEQVVLDPTAAATLLLFGFVDLVESLECKVLLAASFVSEIQELIEAQRRSETLGAIGKNEDGYFLEQHDPDERNRSIDQLESHLNRLVSASRVEGGLALARLDQESRAVLLEHVGMAGAQSCALASANSALLWSDDLHTRQVCAEVLGVSSVWTQLVARSQAGDGAVSAERSEEISATLLLAGYEWISVNPLTIVDAAEFSSWDPDAPRLARVIERFGAERAELLGLVRLLADAVPVVMERASTEEAGEAIAQRMCSALLTRSGGERALRFVLARLPDAPEFRPLRKCIEGALS